MDPVEFVPVLIFMVPIIAITFGFIAGIVRMMHRHRMAELLQRERIAALERGLEPAKIAELARAAADHGMIGDDPREDAQRTRRGLLIAGLCLLIGAPALGAMLWAIAGHDIWTVALIPFALGIALLLATRLMGGPAR
jgi:hypothetical protein